MYSIKDGLPADVRTDSFDDEAFETGNKINSSFMSFFNVLQIIHLCIDLLEIFSLFSLFLLFWYLESDIYEDPSVRFESKKILQPDPTNMENYLVKMSFTHCMQDVVSKKYWNARMSNETLIFWLSGTISKLATKNVLVYGRKTSPRS